MIPDSDDRQELYCHNCDMYVQFNVPAENGRLVIECPNCSHKHYRVVDHGVITDRRWGSSNSSLGVMHATSTTNTTASVTLSIGTSSTTDGADYVRQSWLNSDSSYTSSG